MNHFRLDDGIQSILPGLGETPLVDPQKAVVGKHVGRMNQAFDHKHQEHHAAQGGQRQLDPKEIYGQHRARQQAKTQRLAVDFGMKRAYHLRMTFPQN